LPVKGFVFASLLSYYISALSTRYNSTHEQFIVIFSVGGVGAIRRSVPVKIRDASSQALMPARSQEPQFIRRYRLDNGLLPNGLAPNLPTYG
jgi:hypothetical protein